MMEINTMPRASAADGVLPFEAPFNPLLITFLVKA